MLFDDDDHVGVVSLTSIIYFKFYKQVQLMQWTSQRSNSCKYVIQPVMHARAGTTQEQIYIFTKFKQLSPIRRVFGGFCV